MTRPRARWCIPTLALLLSSGCASPLASFEQALEQAGVARFAAPSMRASSVEVRASLDPGQPVGRGAVIGARWVLTVEHVLGGRERALVATSRGGGWCEGRVIGRVASEPEDLLLLELELDDGAYGLLLGFSGFEADAVLRPSLTGLPTRVLTSRGALPWRGDLLAPGDSGSPVLDDEARLVGLLSGRRDGAGVYVPLTPGDLLVGDLALSGARP